VKLFKSSTLTSPWWQYFAKYPAKYGKADYGVCILCRDEEGSLPSNWEVKLGKRRCTGHLNNHMHSKHREKWQEIATKIEKERNTQPKINTFMSKSNITKQVIRDKYLRWIVEDE
jgi:hypothetical protein